jgi:hypothetical protein
MVRQVEEAVTTLWRGCRTSALINKKIFYPKLIIIFEQLLKKKNHPEFWLRPKFGIFYNRLFMKRLSDFRG